MRQSSRANLLTANEIPWMKETQDLSLWYLGNTFNKQSKMYREFHKRSQVSGVVMFAIKNLRLICTNYVKAIYRYSNDAFQIDKKNKITS